MGVLSPAGLNAFTTSTLTGDFIQSGNGTFLTDIDFGNGGHDVLQVPTATGGVAAGGFVAAHVTNIGTTTTPYWGLR